MTRLFERAITKVFAIIKNATRKGFDISSSFDAEFSSIRVFVYDDTEIVYHASWMPSQIDNSEAQLEDMLSGLTDFIVNNNPKKEAS